MLEDRECTLFRHVGIFKNGFSLESAIAVASADDLNEADVFEGFASLVDKSLVLAEPDGDALRFRLLGSTRAYASEKMVIAGERELLVHSRLRYLRAKFSKLRRLAEQTARFTDDP